MKMVLVEKDGKSDITLEAESAEELHVLDLICAGVLNKIISLDSTYPVRARTKQITLMVGWSKPISRTQER